MNSNAPANDASPKVEINLDSFVGSARVLSGETTGAKAREFFRLDERDHGDRPVLIRFPSRLVAVNSSFLRLFIRPSMVALGIDAFNARYTIEAPPYLTVELQEEMRRAEIEIARMNLTAA